MYNKEQHLFVIESFLSDVNQKRDNPYILKGGTALSLCYKLNRFSEDIDLDVASDNTWKGRFFKEIEQFCNKNGYSYRISKDTATTQRAYIDYGNIGRPLKVEVSYRRRIIPNEVVCQKRGIQVYTLDEMAKLKAAAYSGRDKIRDLYDVAYICTHFYDQLSISARDALRTALEYKEMSQFDYIVETQKDELINVDTLETMFLQSFDKLGLMNPRSDDEYSYQGISQEHTTEKKVSLSDEVSSMREASKELSNETILNHDNLER